VTWMLILLLWSGDGGDEAVILDTGLTLSDCVAATALLRGVVDGDGDVRVMCEPELTRD